MSVQAKYLPLKGFSSVAILVISPAKPRSETSLLGSIKCKNFELTTDEGSENLNIDQRKRKYHRYDSTSAIKKS